MFILHVYNIMYTLITYYYVCNNIKVYAIYYISVWYMQYTHIYVTHIHICNILNILIFNIKWYV